jgi:SAM-dependent methyltransferase
MSWIGEQILYMVASRRYRRRPRSQDSVKRIDSPDDYWDWQWRSSSKLLEVYEGLDITGKEVLDLGCGIGGRTAFLTTLQPRRIVGVDVNPRVVEVARQLQKRKLSESSVPLEFECCQEADLPFAADSFDVVLIIDTLEHVRDPHHSLEQAHRVLRPGGRLYFGTVGWYHHSAAHMGSIVPVPFLTVFFSDRTILNVARRILAADYYQPNQWDSDPPWQRWEGVEDLSQRPEEYLNKHTVRMMSRALATVPFRERRFRVIGFRHGRMLKALNFLSRPPVLREMWHSYLVGVGVK